MGFSARYHAASLAAVFLALAIGILIGSSFGSDIVSSTRRNLERNLTQDVQDSRDRVSELSTELSRSEEFGDRVFPILVGDRLRGRRIGILAFGALPDNLRDDINAALEPAGASPVAIGVIREPVDVNGLAGDLASTRYSGLAADSSAMQDLGKSLGRQVVLGGALFDRVRAKLLSRASGGFGRLDGLIVVSDQPEGLAPDERATVNSLEGGLLDGIASTNITAVGVERTDTDPSSIGTFESADLPSADNVDRVAGRVALIFALLGAQGSFGTKDSADQLLPDLLIPRPSLAPRAKRRRSGASQGNGKGAGKIGAGAPAGSADRRGGSPAGSP